MSIALESSRSPLFDVMVDVGESYTLSEAQIHKVIGPVFGVEYLRDRFSYNEPILRFRATRTVAVSLRPHIVERWKELHPEDADKAIEVRIFEWGQGADDENISEGSWLPSSDGLTEVWEPPAKATPREPHPLIARAVAEFGAGDDRIGMRPSASLSSVEKLRGRTFVILRNDRGVLAMYRPSTKGKLQRLVDVPRWAK